MRFQIRPLTLFAVELAEAIASTIPRWPHPTRPEAGPPHRRWTAPPPCAMMRAEPE